MRFVDRCATIWNCRKEIILSWKIRIDFINFQKQWRRNNPHNHTVAGCKFDMGKVSVGNATYGTLNAHCWDNPDEKLIIGNYCSIAEDVNFILGGVHPISTISTFPWRSHVFNKKQNRVTGSYGPIVVEDDVWICYGATILSGVTIGRGSVIGAKSVVSRDIPPYSIVINGDVRRKRFSDDVIQKLLLIDLKRVEDRSDSEDLDGILELLDVEVTSENVVRLLSRLGN